ncbi:hypothetical protein DC366_19265 [Pelagivirga sediminicola]|uniref:Uncharacterized protein n=1 Tax=Pelagivirga sediminicola TaxID=2170575 RepID=A0A2T7G1Z5_9RHOB|nr:hypothetical protein DC366_19265 [Pelagivirga sediminicola]
MENRKFAPFGSLSVKLFDGFLFDPRPNTVRIGNPALNKVSLGSCEVVGIIGNFHIWLLLDVFDYRGL